MTRTLTLEVDGRTFTYSALVGDRDPMEMTLAEWRSAPFLTAMAMAPTTPLNAADAQPSPDTAETANLAVRLPAEHREPFDYYALIRRIRKSTGKL